MVPKWEELTEEQQIDLLRQGMLAMSNCMRDLGNAVAKFAEEMRVYFETSPLSKDDWMEKFLARKKASEKKVDEPEYVEAQS